MKYSQYIPCLTKIKELFHEMNKPKETYAVPTTPCHSVNPPTPVKVEPEVTVELVTPQAQTTRIAAANIKEEEAVEDEMAKKGVGIKRSHKRKLASLYTDVDEVTSPSSKRKKKLKHNYLSTKF